MVFIVIALCKCGPAIPASRRLISGDGAWRPSQKWLFASTRQAGMLTRSVYQPWHDYRLGIVSISPGE